MAKPNFTGSAVLKEEIAGRARLDQRRAGVPWNWTVNQVPYPRVYHVALRRDECGPVTAYCLELPGAITEADDEDQAERQLGEVLDAMLDEYRRSGQTVPWVARQPEPGDEIVAAITVNG